MASLIERAEQVEPVNAVPEAAPADGLLARVGGIVSIRPLRAPPEVLETKTSHGGRRGWLIRRLLVAADLCGLAAAFLITDAALGLGARFGEISPALEFLVFLATLPVWIVAAKLYGLYDRDEERDRPLDGRRARGRLPPRHGRRLARLRASRWLDRRRDDRTLDEAAAVLGARDRCSSPSSARSRARSRAAAELTSRTRSSSAPATSASSSRASCSSTPSTASTSSASSTRSRRELRGELERRAAARPAGRARRARRRCSTSSA